MDQATLHRLLSRYITNTCTEEERKVVEYWYELLGESVHLDRTEEEWRALELRIWRHIQPTPAEQPRVVRPLWRAAAAAAVIAIAIAFGWYGLASKKTEREITLVPAKERTEWVQHINSGTESMTISLSDSSVVILEPNSALAVSTGFNNENRELRLRGEAAFDVSRNPDLPFIVSSGNVVAKVLGTRFRIKAPEASKPIEVDVQSGKVTVYNKSPKARANTPTSNGLILTPNQKATFFPENNQFVAGLTDNPEPINKFDVDEKVIFNYDETPLREVVRQFEEVYGTQIELEHEGLANCPFTGNLAGQSMFAKLDLICGAFNGTYEVRGTKILITGKSCN